jgi:hypothetical protein
MRVSGGVRFATAMAMVVALAVCSAVYAADDAQIARGQADSRQTVAATPENGSLAAASMQLSRRSGHHIGAGLISGH